jgi:hypothetical protein
MKPIHKRRARGKTRFKGIGKDAEALGVTRIHLWLVLTDERESPTLKERYGKLKAQQALMEKKS